MGIRFLSRGSLEQVSGGYLYNRYLIGYLRAAGLEVSYHTEPAALGTFGPTDHVVVDSIVIGDLAPSLLPTSARLVLLLHVVPEGPAERWGRILGALCRRSRVVVTGDGALSALRRVTGDPGLEAVTIEPGVPRDWRAKRWYAERAQRLLGVANYVRGKGVIRTLRILRELKHLRWTLTLYGNPDLDPPYAMAVARQVAELGLADRILFRGAIPHRHINEEMLLADLLLHFSFSETYSMVTAEAIACGLPVLASRTGNHRVFERSGLVRYLEDGGRSATSTLAALIESKDAYSQLRPVGEPPRRSCEDVGREFLDLLVGTP